MSTRGDPASIRINADSGINLSAVWSTNDLPAFVAQLKGKFRSAPLYPIGDPTVNGYNVWPHNSWTFVHGNHGGLRRTWDGDAVPIEMFSCDSPTGDWLHVELWRIEGGTMIVKMYTNWN